MATLDTFTLTVGNYNDPDPYNFYSQFYGYLTTPSIGSVSPNTSWAAIGSPTYRTLRWNEIGNIVFEINATNLNNSFTSITIGSTTLTEASAAYTQSSGKSTWTWSSSNILGTSGTKAVTITGGATAPDTSVAATSSTITASATSATTTLSGGQSVEEYAVRVNNGSTNLVIRTGNGNMTWGGTLPTAGASTTYEIFARRPIANGGDNLWDATNDTFTVTRSSTGPTYTLNAPASMNEGTAYSVSISTANVTNGTTVYWDTDLPSDFVTATGSTTISSNAGSFNLTPSADQLTEGAQTCTVHIYSDSARTNILSQDTFTINDTSTGGSAVYGFQVWNAAGLSIVNTSDRFDRFVQQGTVTMVNTSSTVISVPGMLNTDEWSVFLSRQDVDSSNFLAEADYTKQTNQFTLSQDDKGLGLTITYDYLVLTS